MTRRPRTNMTPAQHAIVVSLRTAPIPSAGPYPPGTATTDASLKVQINHLRRQGYVIECREWTTRNQGAYHLISEPQR